MAPLLLAGLCLASTPGDELLVDLRAPTAFASSHALGSVSASAWEVARSTAWARRALVLIDAGLPGGPADRLATALRARGRTVSVLAGGFRGWCDAGRATSAPCGRSDVIGAADVGRTPLVVLARDEADAVRLAGLAPGEDLTVVRTEAALQEAVAGRSKEMPLVIASCQVGSEAPGIFWLDGGVDVLLATRAPAALGEAARINTPKQGHAGSLGAGLSSAGSRGGCGCR